MDGEAQRPQGGHDPAQQDTAVDAGVGGVGIREMAADVPQARGTEQGVAEGVDGHVAIGMGLQSLVVGHLDPGEHQGSAGTEAMGVDALADQHGRLCFRR